MIEKEKVLSDAPKILNSDNNPWEVTVEGDSIIGTWKWMDARFFTEGGISDEDKEFTFTVTLKDNGNGRKLIALLVRHQVLGCITVNYLSVKTSPFLRERLIRKVFLLALDRIRRAVKLELLNLS